MAQRWNLPLPFSYTGVSLFKIYSNVPNICGATVPSNQEPPRASGTYRGTQWLEKRESGWLATGQVGIWLVTSSYSLTRAKSGRGGVAHTHKYMHKINVWFKLAYTRTAPAVFVVWSASLLQSSLPSIVVAPASLKVAPSCKRRMYRRWTRAQTSRRFLNNRR